MEQMAGGEKSSPLGFELPWGAECPNGCGLKLCGNVVSCQRCGSVELSEDFGGGAAWLPAEGLAQTRRTRAQDAKFKRQELATKRLDAFLISEWAP